MEATPGQIRELAEGTWLILGDMNGTSTRVKGRTGKVVYAVGGIAGACRKAGANLNLHAQAKDKVTRDAVRDFLRETANVVSLGATDKAGVYRTFVADDWSTKKHFDETTVHHVSHAVNADVDRLTQGESGEVTTTDLWEEFQNSPLGPEQARLIKEMNENHRGVLRDPAGFPLTNYTDVGSGIMVALSERGIVQFRKKNARRFTEVRLTPRGHWAYGVLPYLQTADVAVCAFLMERGGKWSTKNMRDATQDIADETHKKHSAITRALTSLEEEGVIEVDRAGTPYPRSIRLIGEPTGVHPTSLEPTPEPEPEPEPEVRSPSPDDNPIETAIQILRGVAIHGLQDTDELDRYRDRMKKINEMCAEVEAGRISALRALADISDISSKE